MNTTTTKNSSTSAWNDFKRGNFEKAEATSLGLLRAGTATLDEVPLSEAWSIKALFWARCGRREQAASLLKHSLSIYPEDRFAQDLLLILEDERLTAADTAGTKTVRGEHVQNGTLVLGIGTGRCGSTTLSALLNAQASASVSHEHVPLLYWNAPTSADSFHVRRFREVSKHFTIYGDVAHWWLPRVEELISTFPNVRVISLKRDKAATIKSFLKIKGGIGRGAINHWADHDGSFWRKNIWDRCYPKYEMNSLEDCLGAYWDDYYDTVGRLIDKYPKAVCEVATEDLSQPDTQRHLLSFVGVDESQQKILAGLHKNKGKVGD